MGGKAHERTEKSYLEGGTVLTPEDVDRLSGGTRETMTSFTIPEGVASIGHDAFRDCTSLTSITIPDGVTKIQMNTFENCVHLTSIVIPDTVYDIGEHKRRAECASFGRGSQIALLIQWRKH